MRVSAWSWIVHICYHLLVWKSGLLFAQTLVGDANLTLGCYIGPLVILFLAGAQGGNDFVHVGDLGDYFSARQSPKGD